MSESDERVGIVSKRANQMWKAMGEGTVKYAKNGATLLPGDHGYDGGLPMKWNSDGMPVLPGNPEYEQATPIRPDEDKPTVIIDSKFVEPKKKTQTILSKFLGKKRNH